MISKSQRVRNLLSEGRDAEAVRLVARFPFLPAGARPDDRATIQRAAASWLSEELYRGMGYDVAVVRQMGVDAVQRLFGAGH